MEILVVIVIGVLLLLGIIGSIIPVLPGPPFSYLGLLLFNFFFEGMQWKFIILVGIAVLIVTLLDYYLQVYGVQKAGGGKYAIRCSVIGILLGIFFFPPFGILIGAFFGAYVGAKIELDKNEVKIAFGALWGFFGGAILKLCTSFYIIYILLF